MTISIPLFVQSLLRQSFGEPPASFSRFGGFQGTNKVRVGGCPALLRQSGKPSQFAGMEHTILAQGGEVGDDLVIASFNAKKILIEVHFKACHSSRPPIE